MFPCIHWYAFFSTDMNKVPLWGAYVWQKGIDTIYITQSQYIFLTAQTVASKSQMEMKLWNKCPEYQLNVQLYPTLTHTRLEMPNQKQWKSSDLTPNHSLALSERASSFHSLWFSPSFHFSQQATVTQKQANFKSVLAETSATKFYPKFCGHHEQVRLGCFLPPLMCSLCSVHT